MPWSRLEHWRRIERLQAEAEGAPMPEELAARAAAVRANWTDRCGRLGPLGSPMGHADAFLRLRRKKPR